MPFIPFTCLTAAARTCSTVLAESGEGVAARGSWGGGPLDIRSSRRVRLEAGGPGGLESEGGGVAAEGRRGWSWQLFWSRCVTCMKEGGPEPWG